MFRLPPRPTLFTYTTLFRSEPQSGSRSIVEARKIPEYEPPAVYFPYDKMGKSAAGLACDLTEGKLDRKSTRLNSSHSQISYAVFCLKKKKDTKFVSRLLLDN